jgi:hypothetical protein
MVVAGCKLQVVAATLKMDFGKKFLWRLLRGVFRLPRVGSRMDRKIQWVPLERDCNSLAIQPPTNDEPVTRQTFNMMMIRAPLLHFKSILLRTPFIINLYNLIHNPIARNHN